MHVSPFSATFLGISGKLSLVSVSSSDKCMAHTRPSTNPTFSDSLYYHPLLMFCLRDLVFLSSLKKKNQEFEPVANELSSPVMRNNPQNPKETRSRTSPRGGFCMRITYSVLKKKTKLLTSFPPVKSMTCNFLSQVLTEF